MQEALFSLDGSQLPPSTWVYVIGPESSSVVKIGKATDLLDRLAGIQTGNPQRLVIRWAVAGGYSLETALHAEFKDFRLEGEWFDFGVLDPVEEVRNAVGQLLPGQALRVCGKGVELASRPAESDPDRDDPTYKVGLAGCRRMTPLERFLQDGFAPEPGTTGIWCPNSSCSWPFGCPD